MVNIGLNLQKMALSPVIHITRSFRIDVWSILVIHENYCQETSNYFFNTKLHYSPPEYFIISNLALGRVIHNTVHPLTVDDRMILVYYQG